METLHTHAGSIGKGNGGSATKGASYRSGSALAAALYRASEKGKRMGTDF